MAHIVTTRQLTIGYPGTPLSHDLNLTLQQGQLTCLLGPNGVGKSTLLGTLAGYLTPLSGDIFIDGQESRSISVKQRSQLVSVVLTDRIHADNLTVHALVATGRSPYTGFWGNLSARDEAIVRDSLDMVGMNSFTERQYASLSDGEKQKVLIAKAIAQQTPVIILDEPTAFLDYPSKVRTLVLLRKLAHETGKAILLSTHDMEQSLALADSLWLMTPRHQVLTGTVDQLSRDGSLSTCFDCPEMTYNPLTHHFEVRI